MNEQNKNALDTAEEYALVNAPNVDEAIQSFVGANKKRGISGLMDPKALESLIIIESP